MKTPDPNYLHKANEIIYGDREETYGHPAVNLQRIAALWSAYLSQRNRDKSAIPVTPEDVCWMMVLLKMARQMNATKDDNIVDAIGYLALIERLKT